MNIFKFLITALHRSVYDPVWVAKQRGSLGRAIVYAILFLFIVVSVRGILLFKDAPKEITSIWEHMSATVPDFSATLEDGSLLVEGIEQPYTFVIDEEGEDEVLLYINTIATSSIAIEDVMTVAKDESSHVFLITSKKLKIFDADTGETNIEDLSQFPNFATTKDEIGEYVISFAQTYLPWIIAIGAIVVTLFVSIGKALFLLLMSWLVYIIARADKKQWKMKEIYTVGLLVLTVPVLVQWFILPILSVPIPFVYSFLLAGYMFWVVYKGKKSKQTQKKK